ncbi:putative tetratricopeptide-like helical domain superfamily [Helianthus annuus]|nr:putative tetratricopeptide-like helical domain superfamily [Helianthus annuus]
MFLYSKCAHLYDAHKLFDEMPVRDTISFNTIISGCFKKELFSVGFEYFKLMYGSSGAYLFDRGNYDYLISMISGLAQNRYREEGCQIHGLVLKLGINTDFTLGCFSFIFLVFTHNLIYCFCTFHFSLRSLHYKYCPLLRCYIHV